MILILAEKWQHWAEIEQECGHSDWRLVTEPRFSGEYESYKKIPKMILYRASFIKNMETGAILKNKY